MRVGASYFIDIAFSHPDPKAAASIANGVAESYLDEQLEARYQAAQRAATWLSERVGSLGLQLEKSERALAEHRAKYNLVKPQNGTLAEQQAAEVNTQLVAARAQTVEKKAKYDQAQRILEGGAGIRRWPPSWIQAPSQLCEDRKLRLLGRKRIFSRATAQNTRPL